MHAGGAALFHGRRRRRGEHHEVAVQEWKPQRMPAAPAERSAHASTLSASHVRRSTYSARSSGSSDGWDGMQREMAAERIRAADLPRELARVDRAAVLVVPGGIRLPGRVRVRAGGHDAAPRNDAPGRPTGSTPRAPRRRNPRDDAPPAARRVARWPTDRRLARERARRTHRQASSHRAPQVRADAHGPATLRQIRCARAPRHPVRHRR